MGQQLKRCPFCGGPAVIVQSAAGSPLSGRRQVACVECYTRSADGDDAEKAAELWNRRPAESEVQARAAEADEYRSLLATRAQDVYKDPRLHAERMRMNDGGPPDRERWRVYHDGNPVGYGVTEGAALLAAIETAIKARALAELSVKPQAAGAAFDPTDPTLGGWLPTPSPTAT